MRMPVWKLNIFVRAISTRMEVEQRTAEDIIAEYPLLAKEEIMEILINIGGVCMNGNI